VFGLFGWRPLEAQSFGHRTMDVDGRLIKSFAGPFCRGTALVSFDFSLTAYNVHKGSQKMLLIGQCF